MTHGEVCVELMSGQGPIFPFDPFQVASLLGSRMDGRVLFSASSRKIDVEGCARISKGVCVLVCEDVALPAEGMSKLIALDDTLVWTASGSSGLQNW